MIAKFEPDAGRGDRVLAWSALTASALAVIAWAACCVLPIGLSVIGVTLAGTALLAGQRTWLTVAALVVLAVGWVMMLRRRRACALDATCVPPSRGIVALLTVASVLACLALLWQPFIEPKALLMLRILNK